MTVNRTGAAWSGAGAVRKPPSTVLVAAAPPRPGGPRRAARRPLPGLRVRGAGLAGEIAIRRRRLPRGTQPVRLAADAVAYAGLSRRAGRRGLELVHGDAGGKLHHRLFVGSSAPFCPVSCLRGDGRQRAVHADVFGVPREARPDDGRVASTSQILMPVAWWTGAGAAKTGPPVAITADDNKAGHRTAPRCRRRQAVASAGWCRYAWNGIIFIICQVRTGRGACDPTTAWIDSGNISISTHISFRDPTSFRYNHPVRLPLLLSAFCVSAVVCPAAEPPRPNILVVLTDDLGFSDLGCYGSEIETPDAGPPGRQRPALHAVLQHREMPLVAGQPAQRPLVPAGGRREPAPRRDDSRGAGAGRLLHGDDRQVAPRPRSRPTSDSSATSATCPGACNYYTGDKTFRLNGEPWTVPAEGFYTTVANVDLRPGVPRGGPDRRRSRGSSTSPSMPRTPRCSR